ncbi:NAD-dependent epimerase/dehydratase family protein [Calycomorphotria hydatis]|uniref:3 beta-hydroxysteroid dehydrogenase/Delta 5-->4-isomerase n=1 Tax=Calycomorphotria hydatis TaxID=2528027 RepID=A0A517T953_9PLAN|nr:NAD-dependent epimerase/dehydratase family protein [Calycomorphotria hydatis]QDT64911.1 3 beta-hydroxysteroid dehydrogenase/Delta 5-->4-isomerase [Calycomorphotria hydatis]
MYLVTGGGGFLGQYIVEQLVARGDKVRVYCRGKYDFLEELGVETVHGDLLDAEKLESACKEVDTVIHTAARPGVWGSWKEYYEPNTLGTLNLIKACEQQSVKKLIYTSSPSVVFDGQDHQDANETLPYPAKYLCYYPETKALAEQAVLSANNREGLLTISLRPHLIWGPRDRHLLPRLISKAKSGRLKRVGSGKNLVSAAYVENAAAAHLQAADALHAESPAAGKVYFINDPEPLALWEWIDQLLERANLPPVKGRIPLSAAMAVGRVLETAWRVGNLIGEPPMTRFVALQLARDHTYSINAARKDFGYQPLMSHEEAMDRTAPSLLEWANEGN